MKFMNILILVALVASLFMNYTLFTKLEDIDDSVDAISAYQGQVLGIVNSQTSSIQNVVHEIKEQQSWISEIDSHVEINNSTADITFNWQIKERRNNASVQFRYKIGNVEEYTSVPAVDKQNGFYQATIPVEIEIEPQWIIQTSSVGKHVEQIQEQKQNELQYFVSVSYDDVSKNSDLNKTSLNSLASREYGIIDIPVDIERENYYHISVLNFHEHYPAKKYVKNAYLLKYDNEDLIEEEKLISDGNTEEGDAFFKMKQPKKLEYTSIVVKVEYNDGKTFEKKVYSK